MTLYPKKTGKRYCYDKSKPENKVRQPKDFSNVRDMETLEQGTREGRTVGLFTEVG